MVSSQSHNVSPFVHIFDIIPLFAAELEKPEIGMLITISPYNILSKPLAAFPLSKQQTAEREEWILSQWLSPILEKNIGQAEDPTSDNLFSSPQHYWLSYGAETVVVC